MGPQHGPDHRGERCGRPRRQQLGCDGAADHSDGFVGGGQIGYNWQISPLWVVGLESDIAWTDLNGSVSVPGPNDASRIMTGTQKLDWLGTVRGRVGVTPAPELSSS